MTAKRPSTLTSLCLVVALFLAACGGDADVLTGDTAQADPAAHQAVEDSTPAIPAERPATAIPTLAPPLTPAPTPTPTPIPVETIEVGLANNVGLYRGTTIEVLGAMASNVKPSLILNGEAVEADDEGRFWLTLTLGVTNETARTFYQAPADYLLTDAEGRGTTSIGFLDSRGAAGPWTVDKRAFEEVRVAFPTDQLVTDLTKWTLSYNKDGGVPEVITLGTDSPRDYPFALDVPREVVKLNESEALSWDDCDPVGMFDLEIGSASITLDPYYLDSTATSAKRADRGSRWVIITADATNVTDDIGYPCDLGSQKIDHYDVRLLADGRSKIPEGDGNLGVRGGSIERNGSEQLVYRFIVPVETKNLALVWGDDDTAIQAWELDLPTIDGD